MLAESPPDLSVSSLPVGTAGGSCFVGGPALLGHASVLLAGSSETSVLSVLVWTADNPVDAGVSADGLVGGVNEDDFVELEGGVLTNPVGVEDAQVAGFASNTLLSDRLVASGGLLLSDALVAGLSEDATLTDVLLAATSSDAGSVDDITLLGFVAELACLFGSRWLDDPVDDGELTILPSPDSEDETNQLRLLFLPKFFQILVRAHCKLI